MKRCRWCNEKNAEYVKYHDEEWGVLNLEEEYLYEMLILESFQAGLSWECVLNKRKDFEKASDHFNRYLIKDYQEEKIEELLQNKKIIRNRLKIKASIENTKIFLQIEEEFGSFKNYLTSFWNQKILYENDKTTNELSDQISEDLKRRGMKFVGSTIIYSYLQAIGIINSHFEDCFCFRREQ